MQLDTQASDLPLDLQDDKCTEVEFNLKEVWRANGTKQRQRNTLTGLLSRGLRPAGLHIFVSLTSVASTFVHASSSQLEPGRGQWYPMLGYRGHSARPLAALLRN